MKHLDSPDERCTDAETNITPCIAEYIAQKVGCSVNIQGYETQSFPRCINKTQLEAFNNVSVVLEQADATEVRSIRRSLALKITSFDEGSHHEIK